MVGSALLPLEFVGGGMMAASGCESRRVNGAARDVSRDAIGRIGMELALRRDGPATAGDLSRGKSLESILPNVY